MTSHQELVRLSQNEIQKGSKSFSLASLFFHPEEQKACHLLYHWCRYCDDQIDQAQSKEEALTAFLRLEKETDGLFRSQESSLPAFSSFQLVAHRYQIPKDYALDLLKGFYSDTGQVQIQNELDLKLYCYRVAGVVGLMMCQIMGLNSASARENAVALGIAMQMTNIARDVLEDHRNDRVYLPTNWLKEAGLNPKNIYSSHPASSEVLFSMVAKLLDEAELYYQKGFQGLAALPFRAALAVSVASSLYRGIGQKIRRSKTKSLTRRTVLNVVEKTYYTVEGVFRVLPLLWQRLRNPWTPVPLENVWKYTN